MTKTMEGILLRLDENSLKIIYTILAERANTYAKFTVRDGLLANQFRAKSDELKEIAETIDAYMSGDLTADLIEIPDVVVNKTNTESMAFSIARELYPNIPPEELDNLVTTIADTLLTFAHTEAEIPLSYELTEEKVEEVANIVATEIDFSSIVGMYTKDEHDGIKMLIDIDETEFEQQLIGALQSAIFDQYTEMKENAELQTVKTEESEEK